MTAKKPRLYRTGTVLICVLVCVFVTSALATLALQTALRERREILLLQQLRQTEMLLDAGVMRAAAQLHSNSEYEGEQWSPSLPVSRFEDSAVEIRVTRKPEKDQFQVEVIARMGALGPNLTTTQRRHTFSFDRSIQSTSRSPSRL